MRPDLEWTWEVLHKSSQYRCRRDIRHRCSPNQTKWEWLMHWQGSREPMSKWEQQPNLHRWLRLKSLRDLFWKTKLSKAKVTSEVHDLHITSRVVWFTRTKASKVKEPPNSPVRLETGVRIVSLDKLTERVVSKPSNNLDFQVLRRISKQVFYPAELIQMPTQSFIRTMQL